MVSYSDKSEKNSEFVTIGPSKLAKQPNNRKTVTHIIHWLAKEDIEDQTQTFEFIVRHLNSGS